MARKSVTVPVKRLPSERCTERERRGGGEEEEEEGDDTDGEIAQGQGD